MFHLPFSYRALPKGIKCLLWANLLTFILQFLFKGVLENSFALIPIQTTRHLELWRLFTYLFLHGSFFHIFFNLFTLWAFGKELELSWGTKDFLRYYFLCGIGAGLFNILFEPFSPIPIIGASGALYGILLAFGLAFPDALIYLYGIFPLRAKHFLLLIGAIEFLTSLDNSTPRASFAHLGGMLVGFLYLKHFHFRNFINSFFKKILSLIIYKEKIISRAAPFKKEEDLNQQVDKILDKVLQHGPGSLTEKEREIMRNYSSKKK
ncbi:MAG: hypothetical protein A3I11_08325 [Elusimicrobia bacterium RIFCSPLOWO2_02_FULL_39_32]|nr:MAG: hypothetical protein A2034_07555 [Elusimicrobia bacterium GWA2_38_7]OGR79277.1 MAG: hypothetical protein A3B80_08590 [Elusimicrobia bacterium RIFCSPHIGHO2_02_FULL_39_36]OGR93177.1 MAG: hypothetical protein A3I11_08325 [Elusimicrobia bacterium RIFCSPLOWO2_02_FULL_39_32]OGR99402.1 MAG: hypothetical protein A3G85_06770 [Elusimicrobia bacterium RIFCSPLOWO2_12_FULL_39_28]